MPDDGRHSAAELSPPPAPWGPPPSAPSNPQAPPCQGAVTACTLPPPPRRAMVLTYWRAVHALPQARRPNARAYMTHPRHGGVERQRVRRAVAVHQLRRRDLQAGRWVKANGGEVAPPRHKTPRSGRSGPSATPQKWGGETLARTGGGLTSERLCCVAALHSHGGSS
jgi:hypothetical protein